MSVYQNHQSHFEAPLYPLSSGMTISKEPWRLLTNPFRPVNWYVAHQNLGSSIILDKQNLNRLNKIQKDLSRLYEAQPDV